MSTIQKIKINNTEYDLPGGGGSTEDCYKTTDTAETTLADDDKFPFYDTSATGKRSSTWSNIIAKIKSALGTAAVKNVPTSGNASSSEVVMGNDTRLTDSRTPSSHTHGSITNDGAISNTTSIASNDYLLFGDYSDSSKIKKSGLQFDTTNTTDYLRKDGTWGTPSGGGDNSFYLEKTNVSSTSYTFTDSRITTSSVIDVYTDIWGDNPYNVTVSAGSCTVGFTVAQTRTVRVYFK